GATYHSAATARDRDKVREQVLTGLGWNILRVWSTDWWFDAPGCAARLDGQLNELLEASRAKQTASVVDSEASGIGHWDIGHQIENLEEIRDEAAATPEPEPMLMRGNTASVDAVPVGPITPAPSASAEIARAKYRLTDLSGFS